MQAGEEVICSRPDIAVLYTPFTTLYCARCFISCAKAEGSVLCSSCNRFLLCEKCAAIDGLVNWHHHECALFCSIPAAMRNGDTDYLRFILRYFVILSHGAPPSAPAASGKGNSEGAKTHFEELCTNKPQQTEETLAWCHHFASLFAKFLSFPPGVSVSSIEDLLLRIRSNTLGFPFNKDETMGWCLDVRVSMFNHSCEPNCYILPGPDGTMSLKTKIAISQGEELTISYIDMLLPEFKDVEARNAHLAETYCFSCECVKCRRDKLK